MRAPKMPRVAANEPKDERTAKELADALCRKASAITARFRPNDSTPLGWGGLHMDLDDVLDLAERIRLRVRGLPLPEPLADDGPSS